MKIAGYQPVTLLDYPGKVATIVFTQGCNFRCPYCHNSELIKMPEFTMDNNDRHQVIDFLSYLKKREGKIEGVVISGGEPCIQNDLIEFISLIKSFGFLVKLDTNGSNPSMLKRVIESKKVDYIAMDIKSLPYPFMSTKKSTDFLQYDILTFTSYDNGYDIESYKLLMDNLYKSIKLIIDSGIDYEFRTTVVHPYHNPSIMDDVGNSIKGAKRFYIQNYVKSENVLSPGSLRSFTKDELGEMKEIMSKYVEYVEIRGEY